MSLKANPVLFISAVSKELHSARDLVAKTLAFLGYDADWQDIFGTEQGDIKSMLRRRIDDADGVIQLVGQCHGFEPPPPDPDFGRVSYTQYEARYARQRGKRVYPILLDDTFPADPHDPEPEELRQLQSTYRQSILSGPHLYHRVKDNTELENCILKLRQDLEELRREFNERFERQEAKLSLLWRSFVQWAPLVVALLLVLVAGVFWIKHGQKQTDDKVTFVVKRYQKMEQALIRLADVEMKSKQFGEELTPAQLRQRAYATLENELGLPAGSLAKELPAFALEIYSRPDTTLLMRARAAYALNKFDEAERRFLQSEAQDRKAQENAQQVAEKLRTQRIEALEGAGGSALAEIQYVRALEHYGAAAALTSQQRDPLEWARVQHKFGYVLQLQGDHRQAAEVLRPVTEIRQRVLGPDHPDTLSSRNNFASALDGQGKHAEAEALHRDVLSNMRRVLGREHPATLTSRNNLGLALNAQGNYVEAEAEFRVVVGSRQRVLGPEHRATLTSRDNVAIALFGQRKYAEAELEHRAVLSIMLRVLGEEDLDTLKTRNNLGAALQAQRKHAEAETEHRTVLAIRQRVLGREHPDTLTSRNNLAEVLRAQGKYAEAEVEHRAVLAIRQRVPGPEHSDTLISRNNLALALDGQGKHAEAETEYRTVLSMEPVLGPKHPIVLQSCFNLALCLEAQSRKPEEQGKRLEALALARRAWANREERLGEADPSTQNAKALVEELERKP